MLPRIFSTCALLTVVSLAAPARAEAIGVEISTAGQKLAPDELATVQQVLTREVERLSPPKGTSIVVSAQVTRLDTVEDKKTGTLRGLTSGTSVVTSKPNDKSARAQGIEGAVQGATRGLPKLMK